MWILTRGFLLYVKCLLTNCKSTTVDTSLKYQLMKINNLYSLYITHGWTRKLPGLIPNFKTEAPGCVWTIWSFCFRHYKVLPRFRKEEKTVRLIFSQAKVNSLEKWRLRNDRRNSILMMRHHPVLSAFDWLKQIFHAVRPIRSTS